jgi:RNA polymerase sigma-70 factor (ECF subfamily)
MTSPLDPGSSQGPSSRDADEALVARLAQRDESALRELHRRHAALVFGVASRIVGPTSAEDVVQDVFVTLWNKHASFDAARGPFTPWLVQITRRRAINSLRSSRAHGATHADVVDELASDTAPADESQWRAHRQEVIRAAVDALPEAQRQALSLAFFDELTHEQIAKVLGTPVGTAKSRIRLALKRLAPVLLAALAAAALVVFARRREESAARNQDALKMVTASDVVPLRLAPTPGAPPEAHGSYRSRPGARVAVLTTSHLPAVAGGQAYEAWARDDGGWQWLGPVVIESDGRSLLVATVAPAFVPAEVVVTRENGRAGGEPRGEIVLVWQAAGAPPR